MGIQFCETYATNVFPFIKLGNKSAPIRSRDLVLRFQRLFPTVGLFDDALDANMVTLDFWPDHRMSAGASLSRRSTQNPTNFVSWESFVSGGTLVSCAKTYALPQIEIVCPRMAICLGQKAFNAVCRAAGLRPTEWRRARLPGPHTRICGVEIYGLPHPTSRGINNAGGKEIVARSWSLLGQHLQLLREQDNQRS